MGLFSNIFTQSTPASVTLHTQEEGWIAVLYGLAFLDGSESELERDLINRTLLMRKQFDGDVIVDAYQRFLPALSNSGSAKLILDGCRVINTEDRATVFCLACDVVMGDGVLLDDEKSMLEEVAQAMELPDALATSIVEVAVLRHKYFRNFRG